MDEFKSRNKDACRIISNDKDWNWENWDPHLFWEFKIQEKCKNNKNFCFLLKLDLSLFENFTSSSSVQLRQCKLIRINHVINGLVIFKNYFTWKTYTHLKKAAFALHKLQWCEKILMLDPDSYLVTLNFTHMKWDYFFKKVHNFCIFSSTIVPNTTLFLKNS